MTDILGFQKLKICEPHGMTYVLVVMFDGDYLIGFIPDYSPGFQWVKLKEGPGDFGYAFHNLKKEEYKINWNIEEIQYLDEKSIGKLSLCFLLENETTPLLVELLSLEDYGNKKILKFDIFEQKVFDFDYDGFIMIKPLNICVNIKHENNNYIIDNIEPIITYKEVPYDDHDFINVDNNDVEEYDKNSTNIKIPSSTISIEDFTFFGYNDLTSILIPDSVISIGENAFYGCTSLNNIIVDEKNKEYSSTDGVLFDKKLQTLIKYPQNKKAETYIVPNAIKVIGANAFFDCENITNITLPGSIENIGTGAFCGCKNILTIELPNSIVNIGSSAFCRCTSLKTITIPKLVTNILEATFSDCINLFSVIIPYSVTDIKKGVFFSCKNLTNISIDENNQNYKSIDGVLFDKNIHTLIFYPQNKNDKKYIVPNSVTDIEGCAFLDCKNLTDILLPNSVKNIGSSGFSGCKNITNITIPNSVTCIEEGVFNGCEGLANVHIPNSVKNIKARAFYGCIGLKNINIPNSITSIAVEVFKDCFNLKNDILSRKTKIGR